MNTPTIRPATAADHAAWLPLWRGYQAFYKVEQPEHETRITWQRLLDPAEPMHLALAERGGAVVGMVHFIEHRTCWTEANAIYLQDLFTAPEARGQGIGRALIAHVCERARALGCAKVHWLTHETNAQARALYDKVAERPGYVDYRIAIPPAPR
ncbi:MAG TPA: GNAT family N-acetyltransferase [Burkholderiaceae bacterium]|nr:GNAT family N-acetyltransferase [Burkholderiaceae bacterium]